MKETFLYILEILFELITFRFKYRGKEQSMSSEKIIALYERLSREDENLGESYSIQNQKKLLEDFCREKGWTRFRHFTDDGISGTTFERPSFKEMISLVEDGEVETIVLKDMSRLGRDYLVVGQLREFFRKKGVRLIAINDNHDSSNGDDDFLVFRDVMNEMYAKDISKKIRSTFKSKGKSGKHVASVTPYGYLKDENDGNHWIIDEEAAEVVRLIFKWTIDGLGPYQIANLLQEKKVEIPAVHMARFGQGNNRHKQVKDPYGWGSSTVVGILKKREYLGHTVNFKTQKHFKDKKSHYVSEDNWVIFENTQDAIIDQDTFDTVQKLRANVRRYPDGWGEHHVLTGLMYCADCGAKMYVHRTSNGKRIAQYTCSAYTKVPCGTLCKTQHRINESVVLELIGDMLKAIFESAKYDRAEFLETITTAQSSQEDAEVKKVKARIKVARNRCEELEKLICRIYEDNILGKLPDSRYEVLDKQYANEKSELDAEIMELEKRIAEYDGNRNSASRFMALIDKYEKFEELTPAMVNEFVDKVLVHERDRKGSIQTTQEIEIYFNFVGRYVPPAMEVELTPEEQAEIDRINRIKDKRHQQYLRRKESGWQRKYEERVKSEKREKLQAMKEEIRKQDRENGVYATVGSLALKPTVGTPE